MGFASTSSATLHASLGELPEFTTSSLDRLFREARLTEEGEMFVQDAGDADLVLVEWEIEHAPSINTLGYHLRRTAHVPLIAVYTGSPTDAVAAIAAGADDALALPVYPALLQAKKMAYDRQSRALTDTTDEAPHDVRTVGPLQLDRTAHRVFVHGEERSLTAREFALLEYLVDHRGALCTREDILDHVWGIQFDTGTNMVDVYTHFLRRKLAGCGLDGGITTIRGRGYRMDLPSETE